MAEAWLSIIGIGEDGLDGLSGASRRALDAAEIVFGGPRHLALAGIDAALEDAAPPGPQARGRAWPVPFDVAPVLALRGRAVAVLASGDPFHFGAGGALAARLATDEWRAYPAPSVFSLAVARLGWRLEAVACLGLHAAPFSGLRPVLAPGARALCLVRDGAGAGALARWLTAQGFGASRLWVLEALGGPRERRRETRADAFALHDVAAPAAVAVEAEGRAEAEGSEDAAAPSRAFGLPDALFAHDGQITKRAVRALTLSALAPCAGETLWDIGAGSGSVAIEWARAAPGALAFGVEADPARAARARENAARLGVAARLRVIAGRAPEALAGLPPPDAVFIGGGASQALLAAVWARIPPGARLVVNAVTLETEALLAAWSADKGGAMTRIEIAQAAPLGARRGWRAAMPIVQWRVTR